MKYYETTFDDYLQNVKQFNIHPELTSIINKLPENIVDLDNIILNGPGGAGKYSQMLNIIYKYSPSKLKYDKKMILTTDKITYKYKISDIHYEIDMSMLGCNSKHSWHELFFQIIDIISVTNSKCGIIVCYNFHLIHSELLDIFYSYMQHYNHNLSNIFIKFIIISEHISFLPNQIINCSNIINIKKPTKNVIQKLLTNNSIKTSFVENLNIYVSSKNYKQNKKILSHINTEDILNNKELYYLKLLTINNSNNTITNLPIDHFNLICDNIIKYCIDKKNINYNQLRELLYDILTYSLDISECLWYILSYFINNNIIHTNDFSFILNKTYLFFKYFNNNYRPIYHLESIFLSIISKIPD
tara:strand:+ start:9024 stop:10097 length:1074 start_codon:yes stop_codon:yes gene_type:complete